MNTFLLRSMSTIRVLSADQHYELYLDGARIGQGPERGAPDLWFYESYDLMLDAGEHALAARAWQA